ncbi:phage antirepressor N-terminal domain-containing protein [Streptomyces sp. KN37]|uniref:phage antirepressor N-terminal domain-containing protein n=1 Tax=Streptomyces sp. KN37 TaxID=3090667 RepID=UPI002A74D9C8|nr:phage antirepressor N-terminal domain-containing protein [Streptomyces sp. KN37]WPO73971.1 phage antirepressor N-terminal domain-containing protein [Streptomyces sp. KN37]
MSQSSPESREVVKLDLSAGSIHTTLIDGQPHIVLKPAIDELGLAYSPQLRKLKTRSWGTVTETVTVAEDGKPRTMAATTVRSFLMLLANVNENRVAEEIRPTLVAFQNETADAIEAYWTQGGAINPRATEDQLDSLISRAKQQAEVLSILAPIVSPEWLETKGRLVAARALGEEPEVDPLDVPLYVPDFLKSKGLKRKQIESMQSWFGRRAAALYEAEHGEKPGKRQSDLPNGSVRETFAWTARHLPVFEETWDRYYAEQYPVQGVLGVAS